MSYSRTLLLTASCAVLLQACSGTSQGTIGDLNYVPEQEAELNLDQLNHQTVRQEYQDILELIDDKGLKAQIERRIADVYMMEGEQQLASDDADIDKSYYQEAIKSYRDVLERYPDSPDNAEVLYQLAKAYDMEGQQEQALSMLNRLTRNHPRFQHNPEAYFRKGDIYFNNKQYRAAENAYRSVTQLNAEKLRINAHYMLGWSLYKQAMYDEGLQSFAVVLDDLLGDGRKLETLSKIEKPLVKDTLHSMSLALVHNGGAEHIDQLGDMADSNYIWMLYDELGEHYLEKERFGDSAATYRSYVTRFSRHAKAPELHSKLIQSYILGGFPKQALPEKERYVQYYGIHSDTAKAAGGKIDAKLSPTIKKYLEELAAHYHAQGQSLQSALEGLDPDKHATRIEQQDAQAVAAFARAADFYSEFIDSFPGDPQIAEMQYLKAETYFASRQFDKAITNYEYVAYEMSSQHSGKRGAEAGYAAIISYQNAILVAGSGSDKAVSLQQGAVDSMLRFAKQFPRDKRSAAVLTNAAEYMFGLNRYQDALATADDLIASGNKLDPELSKTAYGIKAHSLFKLGRYGDAQLAYIEQRKLVPAKSAQYRDISEQIATAIYKKSEQLVVSKQQSAAVAQLLEIKKLAPSSDVRVTAQYDAATMLLALEQWADAIAELKELAALFPQHKLAPQFPRKLAFAYEQNRDYVTAAEHYYQLSLNDKDADVRREALFISAKMYEKAGLRETAISYFKRYAHAYEQPFDTRMEARYHLATNYQALDDKIRHLYWLRRVIDGDRKGGEYRSERSRWLGAWANAKYGDYFAWEFKRYRLRQPLENSLPKKNEKLNNATARYQQAADYGMLEFVTLSSYKIAQLYQTFAADIRSVRIPSGLSAADREMYAGILSQQAAPYDTLSADLYQANVERAWSGDFNEWIELSYAAMRQLNPARFDKDELSVSYGDEIQ